MLSSVEAKDFVKHASQAQVIDRVEKAEKAEARIERMQRTRRELAMHTAQMGAEVVGSLAGGGIVGYLQAKDYEEWASLGAVALGAVGGMKRLDEPNNPYWQVLFAAANGMGAAVISGYSRDYFSGGQSKPMT